jgi:DnaJ family protein A protein 5
MGAEQSTNRGAAANRDAPKKVDYYELLGVDRQAGDDE